MPAKSQSKEEDLEYDELIEDYEEDEDFEDEEHGFRIPDKLDPPGTSTLSCHAIYTQIQEGAFSQWHCLFCSILLTIDACGGRNNIMWVLVC
jgi:hypothetical protein